jgi:hypothetical protein
MDWKMIEEERIRCVSDLEVENSVWIGFEMWEIGHVIWWYYVADLEETDPRVSDQSSRG